jgi:hypothetical protein
MKAGLLDMKGSQINSFLETLSACGVARAHGDLIRRDGKIQREVAKAILKICGLTTPVEEARSIMKEENFFPPEKVAEILKRLDRSRYSVATLFSVYKPEHEVPFTREILRERSESHVLFYGPDMNLNGIVYFFPQIVEACGQDENSLLMGTRLQYGWHLISRRALSGSGLAASRGALNLRNERPANTREVVFLAVLLSEGIDTRKLLELFGSSSCITCFDYDDVDPEKTSYIPLTLQNSGSNAWIKIGERTAVPTGQIFTSVRPSV